jgi:hypothetical protein
VWCSDVCIYTEPLQDYLRQNITVRRAEVHVYIQEVLGSDLGPEIFSLLRVFRGFPWSFQANSKIVLQIRPQWLLCPFQFIIQCTFVQLVCMPANLTEVGNHTFAIALHVLTLRMKQSENTGKPVSRKTAVLIHKSS